MYQGLASIYDRLSTIDHSAWAHFLEHLFTTNSLSGKRILDLACGTGNMCRELAQRGYKPVGVDLSEEMLAMSESKLRGLGVSLYRADMRCLPPLGQFDAVLCLSDSFNYLNNLGEFREVLLSIREMQPQLLIFDLNTPYYLSQVLGENTFHQVEEDVAYIWENTYDAVNSVCEMQLTFFAREEKDKFVRFDEFHVEKSFELGEIKRLLLDTGWQLVSVYDGYTPNQPKGDSYRWLFLTIPG
jgi:ubiquinone/menaquinone biosynthesis C-methylase UbiE